MYAIVDIETTGLNPAIHEIIEIGVIKVGAGLYEELNLKIKPSNLHLASPIALKVNGFTIDNWKDATIPIVAAKEISSFIDGCIIAGYNVGFDKSFIDQLMTNSNIKLSCDHHCIDVASLVIVKFGHCLTEARLKTVCEHFGVNPEPETHRAINGARKCLEVYKKVVEHVH